MFKESRYALISSLIFIFLIFLSNTGAGQSNSSRRISFSEARRLLAGEDEGNLSHQPKRFSRTRLGSGKVLELYYPITAVSSSPRPRKVTAPGYGILYDSEAAFRDSTRPRHMLEDLIPDGSTVINNIPQLVARLEKRLGLNPGRLDYSRASLRRVDRYIAGYLRTHTTAQTDPRLFQELTAYYGETIRRSVNGDWRIREERLGSSHIQTEPNISVNAGGRRRELKPWSSVIGALHDEDNRGSGLTKAYDSDVSSMN